MTGRWAQSPFLCTTNERTKEVVIFLHGICIWWADDKMDFMGAKSIGPFILLRYEWLSAKRCLSWLWLKLSHGTNEVFCPMTLYRFLILQLILKNTFRYAVIGDETKNNRDHIKPDFVYIYLVRNEFYIPKVVCPYLSNGFTFRSAVRYE